jgi:hypothetical protein
MLKRVFGLLFIIVGTIGAVACLLLLPAVWVGRNALNQEVAALSATVGSPLQQVETAVAELHDRVVAVRGRVLQIADLADSGTLDRQLADRLLERLSQVGGTDYARLREAYATLRERLTSAMELRDRLQRVIPGLALPRLPAEDLAAVDRDLQAFDTALGDIRATLAAPTPPGTSLGHQLAETLRQIDAGLGALQTRLDTLSATIDRAQATVTDTAERALSTLTTVALGLSIVALYGVLLHLALIASGRSWRVQPRPVTGRLETDMAPQLAH